MASARSYTSAVKLARKTRISALKGVHSMFDVKSVPFGVKMIYFGISKPIVTI